MRIAHSRKKTGLPPGTVVYVGDAPTTPPRLSVFDYTTGELREHDDSEIDDVLALRDSETVSWINLSGLHDVDLIRRLGDHFGIHPLVQEDIANTNQHPKMEEFDDHLFVSLKMIYEDAASGELIFEHVSLIIGHRYVISFQETPGDVFDPVRERLRATHGRIRKLGADYLGYALLDVIVDHYFVVLEQFGSRSEELEEDILDDPTVATQKQINALRRSLIHMRRSVWPVREILGRLERLESPLVDPSTHPFLRDAYDHAVQVVDLVESLRDLVSGLTDLYMTVLSNRMNEIMKVLTIIGTIFIPLTFVAGVYGMNFEYMPELGYRYGYPIAWGVMLAVAALLLVFFRRRDWI